MLTAMLGVEIIVRKRRTILDKRKQPRTWGEKEKTLGRVFLLLLTAAAVLHQIGLFQAICPRGSWWEEAFALHLEKGWLVLRWASTG